MHGGTEAVQIFFMISGFYMALIADKYPSAKAFYLSRFLRIYIPYWTVMVGVIIASVVLGCLTRNWLVLNSYFSYSPERNGIIGFIFAAISNLTILGMDWAQFLMDEGGRITFTSNFHQNAYPLAQYFFIAPAWTVGVELSFYLLVPFLNRQASSVLMGILGVSLAGRIFVYEALGWSFDPWNYRFMPFELALFLLGMLSCRVYQAKLSKLRESKQIEFLLRTPFQAVMVGLLVIFWLLSQGQDFLSRYCSSQYARLLSYGCWACLIPIAFHVTRESRRDRTLGDLSYPIYLIHYFLVSLVAAVFTRQTMFPDSFRGPMVAVLSIVGAILLSVLLVSPWERRRSAMVAGMIERSVHQ